jgi:rhodanese-related sulfurtransferase
MTQVYVNEICPSTTQSWIKKGAVLVDVREIEEVNKLKFNVPSLVHIPLTEFEDRYTELPMDKELVIVCQNGARSLRAAAFLVHKGFDPQKVVNMRHGLVRWVYKGFPVVGDISFIEDNTHAGCCSHSHHEHKHENEHNHSSCCGGH